MKTFKLRKHDTHEEIELTAFSWELSKNERMFLFSCEEHGKIIEKAFNTYIWYLWETIDANK